jgi:Domain of unknown function (DUF4129)
MVNPRDTVGVVARIRSHRALTGSVLLAVLVVAAAGISGATHFTGPRWVPNWTVRGHSQSTKTSSSVPTGPRQPPVPHAVNGPHYGIGLLWIIAALAAAGLAVVLWRVWVSRRPSLPTRSHVVEVGAPSAVPRMTEPELDLPAMRTGIELALQVLDEQREPSDAIVRAWLGLQETAEESGIVRQPSETPTEFASRVCTRAFADDRAVRTLLRLYLRTRFGAHPVTDDDVAIAREALHEMVRTWSAPRSVVGTTPR